MKTRLPDAQNCFLNCLLPAASASAIGFRNDEIEMEILPGRFGVEDFTQPGPNADLGCSPAHVRKPGVADQSAPLEVSEWRTAFMQSSIAGKLQVTLALLAPPQRGRRRHRERHTWPAGSTRWHSRSRRPLPTPVHRRNSLRAWRLGHALHWATFAFRPFQVGSDFRLQRHSSVERQCH